MIWALVFWLGLAAIAFFLFGYGAWVHLRARFWPRPVATSFAPDSELPTVTCLMAAANEAAVIQRKIDCLAAQDYPRDKLFVIVVSDASTDGTDAIVAAQAARDPRVRLMHTPRRSGKPTALNLARPQLRTEVAVLMDARQDLTPDALRQLVAHLADPRVGVVSGDLRVRGDSYWTYEGRIRKAESRSGSMVQVTGSLYAIRVRDFPEIPPEMLLDDVYVPLTVAMTGRRIVMAEEAGSLDVVTRTAGAEFARKLRTLAGLVQLCHKLPGVLIPGRNPVWARFIAHKLSRIICAHLALLVLVASAFSPGPVSKLALAAAVGVCLLAFLARLGLSSRLTRLCQSAIAMNLAALLAVPAYFFGWISVTWVRVETDRT